MFRLWVQSLGSGSESGFRSRSEFRVRVQSPSPGSGSVLDYGCWFRVLFRVPFWGLSPSSESEPVTEPEPGLQFRSSIPGFILGSVPDSRFGSIRTRNGTGNRNPEPESGFRLHSGFRVRVPLRVQSPGSCSVPGSESGFCESGFRSVLWFPVPFQARVRNRNP